MECIVDGIVGIYVPMRFAMNYRGDETFEPIPEVLYEGPDNLEYWEAWDDYLDTRPDLTHDQETYDLYWIKPDISDPNQALFDKAVIGVIKQGRPSMTCEGSCRYRNPDGLCCAVGFLIDDEHCREGLEKNPANNSEVINAVLASNPEITSEQLNVDMLRELQNAHDQSSMEEDDFVELFHSDAIKVARKYGLEMPDV